MRIGIDTRLWSETGVGRYIRNLVTNLQEIDNKNEYVLFVKHSDIKKIRSEDSDIRIKDNWKLVITDIRWHTIEEQIKFPRIIKNEKLDLVHFPYFSVPILYNLPYVITIHDLILHHFPTGEASTLTPYLYQAKLLGYKFVIQQAVNKAKKIITVSEATKKEIIDHLHIDNDKIIAIHEGVDSHIRNPHPKRIISESYFLFVGNVYPHKNIESLLLAFRKIFLNAPVRLIVVGKNNFFTERLKEFARKKQLDTQVIFLGEVTDSELSSLYHYALSLVVPSFMEGFGLPALEAMANDCLVIASNIPSLQEVCKDAALYVDPRSIDDIADKLQLVVTQPKNYFAKMRSIGEQRVRSFSWQEMAKETLAVYESSAGLRQSQ